VGTRPGHPAFRHAVFHAPCRLLRNCCELAGRWLEDLTGRAVHELKPKPGGPLSNAAQETASLGGGESPR
jgi:hypothetical protein